MSAVLRVAFAYFDMQFMQRLANAAGLAFLVMAGAALALSQSASDAKIVFGMSCFGVGLILIVPAFGGAIGLRLASRPGVVHLRPNGRGRVLAGTTLAVTLCALIATVPSLAVGLYFAMRDFEPGALRFPSPLTMFPLMWTAFAVSFIYIFAASRSLLGMVTIWLLPVVILTLGRHYDDWNQWLSAGQVLALGLIAWAMFSAWYLRAGTISNPVATSSSGTTGESSPFQWLLASENNRSDEPTRSMAIGHYLLGCASNRFFVITGLWIAGIFVLMHFFTRREQPSQMMFMLPFLIFQVGAMGFTSARRARLLWLRAGLDRGALFRLVEKQTLRAGFITWAIIAAAAVTMTALPDLSRLPQLLLYAAAQWIICVVAFYAGVAIVKNWHIGDMLLFIFLGVLFFVQMAPGGAALRDGYLTEASAIIALVAAVLALALRFHAARRWRNLDWKLAKPLKMGTRNS